MSYCPECAKSVEALAALRSEVSRLEERALTAEEAGVLLQLRDDANDLYEGAVVKSAFAKLRAIAARAAAGEGE